MRLLIAVAALAVLAGEARAQDFDLMQFADTDGDGKVTMTEYTAFSAQGWDFISMGAAKVKLADVDPMFKAAFTGVTPDADGFVNKEAYMAAVPVRFKAADKNGDGALTAAELNASMGPPA
jgi:hypothetical protein